MNQLPVAEVLDQLRDTLNQYDEVVLEAPPGAGKTTLVPLELLQHEALTGQKMLMLEPRRLAARMAAERMAQQLGEKVGQTVGYRVRMDSKIGPDTRIEVITEGILTRMLQDDPSLDGYGLVIFDEFHERSLDADFGLAMALQGRELFRDEQPLKLLLMSATLDKRVIEQLLPGAPLISSQGRMFPVDIRYLGAPARQERLEKKMALAVQQALQEESGSLLVFLPGQREIRNLARELKDQIPENVLLTPLYGDLNIEAQQQAIQPPMEGQRKIVLATNIAETSLTIEGIRVVIDAGLSREARLDPASGMTRLHTCKVSRAASIQRAGRAGRMEPGCCYRLWSETGQEQLAPYANPEILTTDLTSLALQLARWGVNDPAELRWLNLPPAAALNQGRDLLIRLGALEQKGAGLQLTKAGEMMAQLPLHPRLAHMILIGWQLGCSELACDLAALLSERDPLDGDADISRRLAWLRGELNCSNANRGVLHRIRQLSKQFRNIANKRLKGLNQSAMQAIKSDLVAVLLAQAYPDRIAACRRPGGRDYQLSGGRAVRLTEYDSLSKQRWLAIANCGGVQGQSSDKVFLAAALSPQLFDTLLSGLVTKTKVVEWDRELERVCCEEQRKVGQLVLSRKQLSEVPLAEKNAALITVVRKQGLKILPWNDDIQRWRQRITFLFNSQPEAGWPDLSEQSLLETLEQWLMPFLDPVSHVNHFSRLNLMEILQGLLPWPLPKLLSEQAPVRLSLPSGHSAAIDYSESPPVLAVKLQEMFGCTSTPTIGNGVRVKIHLLSPARRPLAVTQDLASFWSNAYREVQKDMKGRYPKHQWPDNPLEALPSDGIKRKKRT
ncbi:ATP-dependent helicase HrpB [Amphritea balenae]|uniref:ATP-dependent helicase HrpB n=1 Tax=Amphritea balenae TaxID=452629 RepID=A0A3P1SUY2_9GAMM|nr:ATP-dependent helicase HrpB [Amphritea balenae]RRC99962.1 ATP-dependent helicase HrpB [Amphritea balenae]GGK75402.1 ATP-dependent helicase [Amphritea balenae]